MGLAAPLPFVAAVPGRFLNWDDDRFIVNNPLFHGPLHQYLWAAISRVQFQAYQPFHLLAYVPDRLLWPSSPSGFHLLNLLVFGTGVATLFVLLRRRVSSLSAALACLLFSWHPLVTEPVVWIAGRKDVLAFTLLAALLLREDTAKGPKDGRLGSTALVAVGILSKSAFMVAPLVVLAWLRFARGWTWSVALRRVLPSGLLALAAGLAVTLLWRQANLTSMARPLPLPIDVAGTLGLYAARLAWPTNLSPAYPEVREGQTIAAALFGLAIVSVIVCWRRLPPPSRFALIAFLSALAPVSNLVPLYFRFADRYEFLAMAALVWPVATVLHGCMARGGPSRIAVLAAVALLLGSEFWVSSRLALVWRDSLTLWERAAQSQPRAWFAYLKLGETHRSLGRWTEASRAYMRAIELQPTSVLGFGGLLLTQAERLESVGVLKPGSGKAWLGELGPALASKVELTSLVVRTELAGCRGCAMAIQWLTLRRFPLDDVDLFRSVELALNAGQIDMAALFLHKVRNKQASDYARLSREIASRRAPR